MNLKDKIRVISDYPIAGISFKDITTLLRDKKSFHEAMEQMVYASKEFDFDLVLSPEARGFVFGPTIAYEEGAGFVPVRKPGKLPASVFKQKYQLEYGDEYVEVHQDALAPGQRVLIVDDLLATGGTTKAIAQLVERMGGIVSGCLYLVELSYLDARKTIGNYPIKSIIKY